MAGFRAQTICGNNELVPFPPSLDFGSLPHSAISRENGEKAGQIHWIVLADR